MKKNKIKFPLGSMLIAIICLLAALLVTLHFARVVKDSDFFKIKDIILSEHKERISDFSYLEGRNIFKIDLLKESKSASELYPGYRKIRLIRIPPNRLFVDFIKRKPLARIKLYRDFCVDEEFTLFDCPEQYLDLPDITGLETKIFGAKPGKKYYIKELNTAIDIIKYFGRNRRLRGYKIERIRASNGNGISLYLSGNLEIKFGQENIRDNVDTLATLLVNVKNDLGNIEYIDLRFKEPVIRPKNAK